MNTDAAKLVGAIRLLPELDTIGIPVFITRSDNIIFVCETDEQLRITDFVELTNEADFHLDYGLPRAPHGATFKLGDPIPIPIWVDGRCEVVAGDADPSRLTILAETTEGRELVSDVKDILTRARDGTFERASQEVRLSNFRQNFQELFESPPVHSRYWVSRMGIAATAASQLPGNLGDVAKKRLRARVIGWVQWFGGKTRAGLLNSLISTTEDRVISKADAEAIWASVVAHKLAVFDWSFITSTAAADLVSTRLSAGLFGHFLNHGPAPFEFQKLKQIDDPYGWFLRVWPNIRRHRLDHAWRLSYLMFGNRDLPVDLAHRIGADRSEKLQRLNDAVRDDLRTFFVDRKNSDLWRLRALELLTENNQIILLTRIVDGTIRSPAAILNPPPGLQPDVVVDLERYAEEPGFSGLSAVPLAPTTDNIEHWLEQNIPADPDEYSDLEEAGLGISSGHYAVWPIGNRGLVIQGWSHHLLNLPDARAVKSFRERVKKLGNKFGP